MRAGTLRYIFIATGALVLAFAVGYALQMPWATGTWPWPDGRLSYIFVGSILAAIAAGLLSVGLSETWGTAAAGAINLAVMSGGMSIFLLLVAVRENGWHLWAYAVWCAVFALLSVGVLSWSWRHVDRDPRPMPQLVRASFAGFAATLLVVGGLLLLRVPVFPWPLHPDSSVMFGWIFVGDAFYFLYGVLYPLWHNARGQLWSFLAYDAFLIPPFLAHFAEVEPRYRLNLIVYMSVLVYSAGLAIFYLFLNGETRARAPRGRTVR
jgi:hypothetical protein